MTLISLIVSEADQRLIVCSVLPMIVLHLYHIYVKMSLITRGSRRSNYDECLCACTCHDALAKTRALLLSIRTQSWNYHNKKAVCNVPQMIISLPCRFPYFVNFRF